jgi:dihydrofolate reductase
MRKISWAINATIDGFADHTASIPDEELYDFFTNYLNLADVVLFGRKTYQLMADYWPEAYKDSESTKSEIEFADKYNSISKIVFSKTLNEVTWNNTRLAKNDLINEVINLKKQDGKNISAGSLSIASQLIKADLIDEFWFLIHPIILGKGKQLVENIYSKVNLKLIETKSLNSGVVILHYQKI